MKYLIKYLLQARCFGMHQGERMKRYLPTYGLSSSIRQTLTSRQPNGAKCHKDNKAGSRENVGPGPRGGAVRRLLSDGVATVCQITTSHWNKNSYKLEAFEKINIYKPQCENMKIKIMLHNTDFIERLLLFNRNVFSTNNMASNLLWISHDIASHKCSTPITFT